LIFTVIFIFSNIFLAAGAVKWRESKSTHFIVYYQNAPEDFINKLTEKAEGYYDEIAQDLGFTRFNFWLWDNRARIYIYDNAKDFQQATGQPEWSAGAAMPQAKIIQTYPYAQDFMETVLPHEMGHIIFREFVGFGNYAVTLWLDEGVATYQEALKRQGANGVVKQAMRDGKFMDMEELSRFDAQRSLDKDKVSLFYMESVSIIDYLIKEFGRENFVLFCQNLRDKKNLNRAIASAYPFSSVSEMAQSWQKYLKR